LLENHGDCFQGEETCVIERDLEEMGKYVELLDMGVRGAVPPPLPADSPRHRRRPQLRDGESTTAVKMLQGSDCRSPRRSSSTPSSRPKFAPSPDGEMAYGHLLHER